MTATAHVSSRRLCDCGHDITLSDFARRVMDVLEVHALIGCYFVSHPKAQDGSAGGFREGPHHIREVDHVR